jgi:hypothetical protein
MDKSSNATFNGGAELGRGFNGFVVDVFSADEDDSSTLSRYLAANMDVAWVLHTLDVRNLVVQTSVTSPERKQAILEGLMRSSSSIVAKVSRLRVIGKRRSEIFKEELESTSTIFRAYGSAAAKKHLAIDVLRIGKTRILAVSVESAELYAIFSRRCGATLDNHTFDNYAGCKAMVVDLLSSLAILHKSGWLHGDMKPDNVICCNSNANAKSASKTMQYRIIDFGGAINTAKLEVAWAGLFDVIRARSPVAWYVTGSSVSTSVFLSKSILAFLYGRRIFVGSSDLVRARDVMHGSFERYVARCIARDKMTPLQVECLMQDRLLPYIDIAALGITLSSEVFQTRHGFKNDECARMRRFIHDRMLNLDNPRFLGHDAALLATSALREL